MKLFKLSLFFITLVSLASLGCKDEPEIVTGCTNADASNYNPLAETDDGSCKYPGCTDENAFNYDPSANDDDGTCIFKGCSDPDADNFDAQVNEDDGSCTYYDNFLGSYFGAFLCEGVGAALLQDASMVVSVAIGGEPNEVDCLVSNNQTNFSLLLNGIVTVDKLTINTYIESIPISIDGLPTDGPFEVTVTGVLDKLEDERIMGDVNLTITDIASGLTVTDVCNYDATKM